MTNLPNHLALAAAAGLYRGGTMQSEKDRKENAWRVNIFLVKAKHAEADQKLMQADNERGHLA